MASTASCCRRWASTSRPCASSSAGSPRRSWRRSVDAMASEADDCPPGTRLWARVGRVNAQDLLEPLDLLVRQRSPLHPDPDGRPPVENELRLRDFHGDDLGIVVAQVEAALHAHDRVLFEDVYVGAHRLREDHDLEGGAEILEDERGHEIAPLRVPALERGHDPPDDAQLPLAQLLELGE